MKPASLHDRIRQDIESRIMSGTWEAGHRIPPEHELMADYGCSRMTVSKAISALVERGLIDRRKRAGSFVAAPTVHRATIDIPDIAAEIEGQGRRHALDMRDQIEREAGPLDRTLLAMDNGPVLALFCLHRADGTPFALEERLINLSIVPAARTIDFTRESPGRWLLGHVPWTDARHRITAIAATCAMADSLGLGEGAPCLSIERWTWRTAERITYVRQIYPGDHELTARFIA
ncbi:histidine utilization repressor [Sphingobium sp. BYY-5]|uniref:histidine utilization repressor n=1 Tax=Sphingobium sp. BYY-5 TaxID=2926400 RepID=UPI001FA7FDF7|nr:histidine utilization repressor [Sphingobium sp. BYY-5]